SGQSPVWLDHGTDNDGGVTWSDVPKQDGRHLFIGWMSNWQYANKVPTQRWRSAMTIARQLELEKRTDSYIVSSQPVANLSSLASEPKAVRNSNVKAGQAIELVKLTQSAALGEHIKLELDLQQAKQVELSFENAKHSLKLKIDAVAGELILDRTKAGIADFEAGFAAVQRAPLAINAGKVQLEILLDSASIEVFADNG